MRKILTQKTFKPGKTVINISAESWSVWRELRILSVDLFGNVEVAPTANENKKLTGQSRNHVFTAVEAAEKLR